MDGPLVAFDSHGEGDSMAALVGGEVAYDGRCLTLDGLPTLWPAGTTWDEQSSAVVLPDGTSAPIGTTLSAGGGVVPFANSAWGDDQDATSVIEQCLDPTEQVVSFNTGANPTEPPQPPA